MKEKLKRFWEIFKLRLSLFRIWFLKNILVFIQVFLVVCAVLMFSGVITAETPLLGTLLYPLFSPLLDEINTIIAEKEIDGVMSFLGVALSILMSVCLFTAKTKSIAEKDIKSIKTKAAMVKANLYFNTDGKLVKKVEKATGMDLDGDGIVDGEARVNSGFFHGIKNAWDELVTILSVKFGYDESDPDKDGKLYEETLKNANLNTTEEAIGEIKDIVRDGTKEMAIDKVEELVDQELKKIDENEDFGEIKEEAVKHSGNLLKGFFTKIFTKKEKEDDIVIESSGNDELENDIIEEKPQEQKPSIVENKKESQVTIVVNTSDIKKTKEELFIESLRQKKKA